MSVNNGVINYIKNKLGDEHATNYHVSAPMFNAIIETSLKRDYFLESSMFIGSDGKKMPREYCLKCIGDSNISKIFEFESKIKAFDFFDSIEFLPSGALVVERSLTNYYLFIAERNLSAPMAILYDGAYSSAYKINYRKTIISYTEGDYLWLHFSSHDLFESECISYIKFNKDNN